MALPAPSSERLPQPNSVRVKLSISSSSVAARIRAGIPRARRRETFFARGAIHPGTARISSSPSATASRGKEAIQGSSAFSPAPSGVRKEGLVTWNSHSMKTWKTTAAAVSEASARMASAPPGAGEVEDAAPRRQLVAP